MNRITILESKLHDICELSKTMRLEHQIEVMRSSRYNPERALLTSYLSSCECYTVLDRNEPIFMFGISRIGEGIGTIWALGSKSVDDVSFEFATLAKREVLPLLMQKWKKLSNQIDAQYTKGIRFIEFLGAKINYNMPVRKNGYDFLDFEFIQGGE